MRSIAMIGSLVLFAAAPLSAQGKTFRTGEIIRGQVLGQQLPSEMRTRSSDRIPPGHLPPAGMCRIWVDGVPPGQQPAPTDCQTAVATKPANARVIWGDREAFPGKANGKFTKQKSRKQKDKIKRDGRGDDDDDDLRKSVARRGRKG